MRRWGCEFVLQTQSRRAETKDFPKGGGCLEWVSRLCTLIRKCSKNWTHCPKKIEKQSKFQVMTLKLLWQRMSVSVVDGGLLLWILLLYAVEAKLNAKYDAKKWCKCNLCRILCLHLLRFSSPPYSLHLFSLLLSLLLSPLSPALFLSSALPIFSYLSFLSPSLYPYPFYFPVHLSTLSLYPPIPALFTLHSHPSPPFPPP